MKTALPQLGFGAGGVWKRRDEEKGEKRRAERRHLVDKRQQDLQQRTASGRTKEAQVQNKLSRSVKQTKLEQLRATQWKLEEESPQRQVDKRPG